MLLFAQNQEAADSLQQAGDLIKSLVGWVAIVLLLIGLGVVLWQAKERGLVDAVARAGVWLWAGLTQFLIAGGVLLTPGFLRVCSLGLVKVIIRLHPWDVPSLMRLLSFFSIPVAIVMGSIDPVGTCGLRDRMASTAKVRFLLAVALDSALVALRRR
jgi:hypothetical protein